jgi:hypothetical protein
LANQATRPSIASARVRALSFEENMTNKLHPLLVICICGTVHAGQLGTMPTWISNASNLVLNNDDYVGTFENNPNKFRINESSFAPNVQQSIVNTERIIPTIASGGTTEYAITIGGIYFDADAEPDIDVPPGVTLDSQFQVQLGFGTGDNFVRARDIAPQLQFDAPDVVSPPIPDYKPGPSYLTPYLRFLRHDGDTLIYQGSSTVFFDPTVPPFTDQFARINFRGPAIFRLPLDIPDMPATARAMYAPTDLQGLAPEDIPFTARVGLVPGQWGTWNVNADANWSHGGNWIGSVPNGPGTDATFSEAIKAPRTVTVDGPVTVGRITFNVLDDGGEADANDLKRYTFIGSGGIMLDGPSMLPAEIKVSQDGGSHTFSTPLTLVDDTIINVIPRESNLLINGEVHSTGKTITKSGRGALTMNNVRAAQLNLNGGTVAIAPNGTSAGTSVLGVLTISGGAASTAKLDLSNNAAIIDYDEASPVSAVHQQIISGRGGPGLGKSWNGNGITSSAAAAANASDANSRSIGYAENIALPLGAYTTFRGQPVDDTSLLIAFTRTGDANLDGVVNDDDVTIVSATYAPGVAQPHWALGDFDYNGFVDDDDVTLLGAFYDPSAAPLASTASDVAAVPEPSTWMLLVGGLAALGVSVFAHRCLLSRSERAT